MVRILFILLSSFMLLYGFDKEILLLHSYNKGLKWSDGVSQGVSEVFSNYLDYEVTTEYMDSKKIDSDAYFKALLNLYDKKFANRDYRVVIAADNFAFEFALKYKNRFFPNSAIVFCGVENFDPSQIDQYNARSFTTGVVEYKEVEKSLELIKKLIPNLKTIYILSDKAYSSMRIKEQIFEAKKKMAASIDIIYDNEVSLKETPKVLKKLPIRSAILFTSLYRDKDEEYLPYAKLRTFFNEISLPIFALTSIHLGEGIVGGIMVDPIIQGKEAAKMAIRISQGELPSQIPIATPPARAMFDFNVMSKHQISAKLLPDNAIIINKPLSFLEKNRDFVNSVFTLSPLLIGFTLALLFGLYKKTTLEEKLKAQNDLDNVLLNNIQSAIFWRSHEAILMGCNQAFCKLLNKSKEEIIGQHISKVAPSFMPYLKEDGDFLTDLEISYPDIDGKERLLMIRRKRFERGVVTIATDVTQMRQIEREYKRHEQFVLQRSKQAEVGEMLNSIAHQWKTPLIEISAIAQSLIYLRKKRDISLKTAQEFAKDIMDQVTYMTQTIDDFRAFIKPSTKPKHFSLKKAIENILTILNHTLKYNYIDVNLECKNIDTPTVYGYPNEFKQTLLNIINNAKDAILAKRAKGQEASKINIHLLERTHQWVLNIEDDGEGFKEDALSYIFDPFYSTKKNGDGFGLYMAKLIIEDKMNGTILASNHENGARITIYLEKSFNDENTTS
jgi:signal transduction histidine kinase